MEDRKDDEQKKVVELTNKINNELQQRIKTLKKTIQLRQVPHQAKPSGIARCISRGVLQM